MTFRAVSHTAAAARTAAALLAGAGLLALGACEQRPEPHPTYTEAPPAPEAPLAGEPQAAPTMAPPEAEPAPPPEPPPPPPSVEPMQGLVAMAPIPNPPERAPTAPQTRRWGYAHRAWRAEHEGYGRSWRHHHRHGVYVAAARAPAPAMRPAVAPPTSRHAAAHAPTAKPAVKHVAPAAPAAVAVKPAPTHEHRATKSELAKSQARKAHGANTTGANATANATGASADQRTEALRSALSAALAKGAVLNVPKGQAEGASDVTLTVPADFYDTLQKEAGKQAMGDSAASVNLDATLSGDGWSIIPSGAQSQPLHAGQPTVFKWTVTSVKSATGVAAGQLRADVNADLLGGGSRTLALGAVDQQGAPGGAAHWWGAALLALVVLLGLGFLLRGRAGASAPAQRRAGQAEVRRPFDINNGNGDYRP